MSFFKKIFGGHSEKRKPNSGAMPTRALNLQFSPTPENAEKLAQQFVGAVMKNEKKELDYSIDTMDFVDNFLQRFSDEGLAVNDFAETIFVAGAYVGQVMVQKNNGVWIRQEEANLPNGVTMMPIVVRLPNGNVCDPIAKAFKRFHNGEVDNIEYFYHVFTSDALQGGQE